MIDFSCYLLYLLLLWSLSLALGATPSRTKVTLFLGFSILISLATLSLINLNISSMERILRYSLKTPSLYYIALYRIPFRSMYRWSMIGWLRMSSAIKAWGYRFFIQLYKYYTPIIIIIFTIQPAKIQSYLSVGVLMAEICQFGLFSYSFLFLVNYEQIYETFFQGSNPWLLTSQCDSPK